MSPSFLPRRRLLLQLTLAFSFTTAQAASMAPVAAENGMVVTAQHLSTRVGVDVLKDGGNAVVVGTPGGSRIITAVLHNIVNVIDYGMNLQEAVDAPRFHQQWLPESTNVEAFAPSPETRSILEGWGHQFAALQPANHIAAILVGAPSLGGKPVGKNRLYGAIDPRRPTGSLGGY